MKNYPVCNELTNFPASSHLTVIVLPGWCENLSETPKTWRRGYKTFSISTQLSMKFQMLIYFEKPQNQWNFQV